MKKMLRRREQRIGLANLREGTLSGVAHCISYINGYFAASHGRKINDYSYMHIKGSNLYVMQWRAGWNDSMNGKPMNPYAYEAEVFGRVLTP